MHPPFSEANSESQALRVLSWRIRDAGELEEVARGWDVGFRQLGPPARGSQLFQVLSPDLLLTRVRFGMPLLQAGGAPPGMRTFGFVDPGVRVPWCRSEAGDASLLSFGPGGSFESLSGVGFGAITISVREEALARVSESFGLPEPADLIGEGPRVFACDPESLAALREDLARIADLLDRDPRPAGLRAAHREMDTEVPARILGMAASGRLVPERSTSAERSRIVARSLEYLEDHGRELVGVGALCDAVRCNERTLRRAFLERFGVPPRRYLKLMRLNGVNRELRGAKPRESLVTDVANDWGFWHMGAFAADYRRIFGELPSETLARRNHSTRS